MSTVKVVTLCDVCGTEQHLPDIRVTPTPPTPKARFAVLATIWTDVTRPAGEKRISRYHRGKQYDMCEDCWDAFVNYVRNKGTLI